jgi:serine/threonine-protein kinase ATR
MDLHRRQPALIKLPRPGFLPLVFCFLAALPATAENPPPPGPATSAATTRPHAHPTMRQFMGLNVHTIQFKPDLYAPVCRRLRDYHPLRWDVAADDPSKPTSFPMSANGVDWGKLYGSWTRAGFDIDACVMFDDLAPQRWKDPPRDARNYGAAFARFFGPSGGSGLVSAVEIGNEPAKYTDDQYRAIFEAMAAGLRAGDSRLKIATCAVMTGKPDQWSKPLSAIAGLEPLYDVLNVHSYPFKEKWPTWRRSYPEDPAIDYLKAIGDVIRWRDDHVPDKEIWLTEFGYDSASKPPPTTGPWRQWVGVSDEQQAQYIVRSFLVLSAMDLDRAYLYFFNDKDEPQLHAASGITRNYRPKPSLYAMAHLYRSLADYRFARAVTQEEGKLYCFEFEHAQRPGEQVYVAWSPTGEGRSERRLLNLGPASGGGVYRAERMTMTADGPATVEWTSVAGGVEVEVTGTPLFLWAR